MSELTNKNRKGVRWHLLTTVSALALIAASCEALGAEATDDHPTLWIELGGQLERQTGEGNLPTPPFIANYADSLAFKPISPGKLERVPLYSEGVDAKITFQPEQSNWIFSAGIRFGRSSTHKDVHQGQLVTDVEPFTRYPRYQNGAWQLPKFGHFTKEIYEFGGVQVDQSQKHTILDFSAGMDVGMGMLGRGSSSNLSLGVRFAQFVSNSSSDIHARPDALFADPCNSYAAAYFAPIFPSHNFQFCFPREPDFHTFAAASTSQRKFNGVGPSVAWNGAVPIVGNPDDEDLTIDWGINAALLFGRQRAKGTHQTHGSYYAYNGYYNHLSRTSYTHAGSFNRSRRVTIPNLGGSLGFSLSFPNAKFSIGYRGDFFFGAMDAGIDTRKTGITGFYGPFASISIGLGD